MLYQTVILDMLRTSYPEQETFAIVGAYGFTMVTSLTILAQAILESKRGTSSHMRAQLFLKHCILSYYISESVSPKHPSQ